MSDMFLHSTFFGAFVTFLFYQLGTVLKKKTGLAIFNPILVAAVLIIVLLKVFSIDYEAYSSGAKYITYLLTPTTVCLAIPLYEQFELLKKHPAAIMAGIITSVVTTFLLVLAFSILFGLSHREFVTFLPKSITTAIGISLSEEMGGIATVTVLSIIITGIFGNMIAESFLKLIRVTDPVAKGIAIGTSAHVMGTAKAMELGETEGAMSSLSIAVAGVVTVVVAPLFAMIG